MKRNFFLIIMALALLGLYIGFSTDDLCYGPYRQNVVDISVNVPFVPTFWHFFLGYGNKHYELNKDTFYDPFDKKMVTDYSGCAYDYQKYRYLDVRQFDRSNFIDLHFWR